MIKRKKQKPEALAEPWITILATSSRGAEVT